MAIYNIFVVNQKHLDTRSSMTCIYVNIENDINEKCTDLGKPSKKKTGNFMTSCKKVGR